MAKYPVEAGQLPIARVRTRNTGAVPAGEKSNPRTTPTTRFSEHCMSMIAAGTSTRTSALVMLLAEHKATLLGRPAAAPQRSRYGTYRAESVPRSTCGAGKTVAETRCNGPAASWWHLFFPTHARSMP